MSIILRIDMNKMRKIFVLSLIILVSSFIFVSASYEIKAPQGITPTDIGDNGNKKYTLNEGQSITVVYTDSNGKSKSFEYKNLQKTDKGIDFTFDNEGKVIEAHFKTSKEGNYVLGNQEIPLSKGAEVDFSNGEAKIKMPKDSVLKAPKIFSENKKPDSVLSYTSENGKFLFENGNFFRFDKNNVLKYDGNFYFENGKAEMKGMQIVNPGIKTYIDFEGKVKNYNGAYISMDEKNGIFVTGSNIDQFGPIINFQEGNPYGLRVRTNDHIAVQALGNPEGNYVKITNRDNKKIPLIPNVETLNEFAMNVDGKTVHYNSEYGKLYLSPKVLIENVGTGKSSVPIEINSFKTKDGKIEKISTKSGNVLGIGDNVEIAWGKNPAFIQTDLSYPDYPSLKKGFSNVQLYYNLKNVDDINRFLGGKLIVNDYTGELKNPKNVKRFTDLLAGLPNPVYKSINEIRIQNNIPYGNNHVAGLTHTNGLVQITGSNFNPRILRHEITHSYQFRNPNDFWNEWKSVGYYTNRNGELAPSAGYASNYGSNNLYEDGAEYGNYIYEPNFWSPLISNNNQYNKIYRGKLSVLRKNNFITQKEYDAIFRRGGLDSSNPQRYIDEAKSFVSGKR